jgi:hypothetical protein
VRLGGSESGGGAGAPGSSGSTGTVSVAGPGRAGESGTRPVLAPGIREFFVPPFARGEAISYRPALMASAEVRFSSARHQVEELRSVQVLVPLEDGAVPFSLDRAASVELPTELLDPNPLDGVGFASLPAEASQPRSYDRWGRELVRWIQSAEAITLFESKGRKAFSRPGESEREFRMRLADLGREARDAEGDRLRRRYEPRFRTLQDRLLRAEQAVDRKGAQSRQAVRDSGLATLGAVLGAAGASPGRRAKGGLLGAFLGGGASKTTAAIRSAGRVAQSRQGVAHAEEIVGSVRAQIEALEDEFQEELRKLEDAVDVEEALDEVVLRPALNAISLRLTALVWLPWGIDPSGAETPLWR